MISAKPTEKLMGITLEGDYDDFHEIVDSIHRMSGLEEDVCDEYYAVKNMLLSVCYEIRHAFMGYRDVKKVDNGVHGEMMKWHSMKMPKTEVHFSVNLLFPEAVFVALSSSELYVRARRDYGIRAKRKEETEMLPAFSYADYIRDKAVIDKLSVTILGVLAEVIGDEELEKLMKLKENCYTFLFWNYAEQYVYKCNIEYLKTVVEKRKDKIRNIAKRFLKQPDSYKRLKQDLEYSAKVYHCSVHELEDPKLEYPEEIEW